MKLCVCIGKGWQEQWPVYASKADLLELRIDLMFPRGTTATEMLEILKPLCSQNHRKIILTCRTGDILQEVRFALFLALLPFAPAYMDLEYDTPQPVWERVLAAAQKHHTKIIGSCHNDMETPSLAVLTVVVEQSFARGADLVKIVARCADAADEARLMALYRNPSYTGRLIVFGMGPYGLSSRLHAAVLGAPILYAAPDHGTPTAAGQPGFTRLQEHLLNVL